MQSSLLFMATGGSGFPVPTNVGNLDQLLPDTTRIRIAFAGSGNALGTSNLNIEQSVGGVGPWTSTDSLPFSLNGSPVSPVDYRPSTAYANNDYFRARWTNSTLGYTGPYTVFAGPTTKARWNPASSPIAPTAITAFVTLNPVPGTAGGRVTITHSLANSANYSNIGVKVTMVIVVNNGTISFNTTLSGFFSGWGSSVGASQSYDLFYAGSATATGTTSAHVEYYVLGDPLPGILGASATI